MLSGKRRVNERIEGQVLPLPGESLLRQLGDPDGQCFPADTAQGHHQKATEFAPCWLLGLE